MQADRHRLWELQTHLGLPADASKLPAAGDFDQRRIAHNAALAQGRGADALRLALQQELAPPRARFEDGSELLGVRFRDGTRPVLTLLFRAGDASPKRRQPRLRSQGVAGPPWEHELRWKPAKSWSAWRVTVPGRTRSPRWRLLCACRCPSLT